MPLPVAPEGLVLVPLFKLPDVPDVPLPLVPDVLLPVPPEEEGLVLFVSEPLPLVDPLPLVELLPLELMVVLLPGGMVWIVPLVLEGGVVWIEPLPLTPPAGV